MFFLQYFFSSLAPISTGSEADYGHTCKGLSFFVVSNASVLCVVMHKCSSPLKLWGGVWYNEALPGGGSHVAHLNFKTSHVGVCKCLSLIVGFAITVAIWPRKVVSCRDFILRTVATFWAMSLVGIYHGRASIITRTTGPRWIVLSTG